MIADCIVYTAVLRGMHNDRFKIPDVLHGFFGTRHYKL